jgi:hypothetical protein
MTGVAPEGVITDTCQPVRMISRTCKTLNLFRDSKMTLTRHHAPDASPPLHPANPPRPTPGPPSSSSVEQVGGLRGGGKAGLTLGRTDSLRHTVLGTLRVRVCRIGMWGLWGDAEDKVRLAHVARPDRARGVSESPIWLTGLRQFDAGRRVRGLARCPLPLMSKLLDAWEAGRAKVRLLHAGTVPRLMLEGSSGWVSEPPRTPPHRCPSCLVAGYSGCAHAPAPPRNSSLEIRADWPHALRDSLGQVTESARRPARQGGLGDVWLGKRRLCATDSGTRML